MMAMAILEDLISRNEISMKIKRVSSNPVLNMDELPDGIEHYRCRLVRPGRRMDIYLSVDSEEGQLTPPDVLLLLAMDASGCQMLEGYEHYQVELGSMLGGSDGNIQEIEEFWKEYKGRCRQAEKLKSFLGDSVYKELMQQSGFEDSTAGIV